MAASQVVRALVHVRLGPQVGLDGGARSRRRPRHPHRDGLGPARRVGRAVAARRPRSPRPAPREPEWRALVGWKRALVVAVGLGDAHRRCLLGLLVVFHVTGKWQRAVTPVCRRLLPGLSTKKGDPSGSPSLRLLYALTLSAHTSRRGYWYSRAGASGTSYPSTARPTGTSSVREGGWVWGVIATWLCGFGAAGEGNLCVGRLQGVGDKIGGSSGEAHIATGYRGCLR